MNKLVPSTETPAKKVRSERDKRVVDAYEAQGDHPDIPFIADAEKISQQTVRNILSNHGIKPVSAARRGPKRLREQPASSLLHARIAQVVRSIYANYELEHGSDHNVAVIAAHIGINAQAFVEIAAGRRDIRLSELIAIAKATKPPMSLPQLVTMQTENE